MLLGMATAMRLSARSACSGRLRDLVIRPVLSVVLEDARSLPQEALLRKDEGMLFHIANDLDARHRDGKQYTNLGMNSKI